MRSCFFLLLAAALLFTADAGAAETKPARPSYYGTWASPDCGNFGEALVFTKDFALKSTEAKTEFSPVQVQLKHKDYDVVTLKDGVHPVQRTEDGILRIGVMEEGIRELPETWDDLSLAGHSEYMHCETVPSVMPVPLVRVMQRIEAVKDACAEAVTPACGKLLFSLADSNGNKKLSPAEFKKLGAMLETFTPLLKGEGVLTADLEAGYKKGIADGEKVSEELIGLRDKNGSGDLDEKEMTGFLADLDDPALRSVLKDLGALFPAFSAAAGEMGKGKKG